MKNGISLIWDAEGKFIEQSWLELSDNISKTHGGLGIVADDFVELLTYQSASFRDSNDVRRMGFTKITLDAVQEKDIILLAKILAVMMIEPWSANIECGWFIYCLAEKSDLFGFDAKRAAWVINKLYNFNYRAAVILLDTLKNYVRDTQSGEMNISNEIIETGIILKGLIERKRMYEDEKIL
jgi:hypothetical protein